MKKDILIEYIENTLNELHFAPFLRGVWMQLRYEIRHILMMGGRGHRKEGIDVTGLGKRLTDYWFYRRPSAEGVARLMDVQKFITDRLMMMRPIQLDEVLVMYDELDHTYNVKDKALEKPEKSVSGRKKKNITMVTGDERPDEERSGEEEK